jgi:hypothetical protein
MTLYLPGLSFVAVPKTATIAIETAFAPFAQDFKPHDHSPVGAVKSRSSNPCVAAIRHPLDWMRSYYRYLRYSPYCARSDSIWGLHSKTFEQFVAAYIRGQHMWPEPKRTQGEYVHDAQHRVEHLYRYDNLPALVTKMSEACGAVVEIDRHNVGRGEVLDLSRSLQLDFERHAEADFNLYETAE